MDGVIDRFEGDYRFLSNFWKSPVTLDGVEYPTNENAFQAAKTVPENREQFLTCSPGEAKALGRKVFLMPGWEERKLGVMSVLNHEKFTRYDDLRTKLLATGTAELIEGNTWNDRFWGVCEGVGQNHLGKILMQIRSELSTP